MNIDNINDLPKWDDREHEDNDGEGWKPNPTKDACKAMYTKWGEIISMLNGALSQQSTDVTDNDEATFMQSNISMIVGDAYEVGAKIRSSEAGGIYIIRMENASIIRKNAQFIKSALLTLTIEGALEENYCEIIRTEIDAFRELFKQWVSTFEKDEFEDEWGLFI
jgi:hypothetical protein